MERCTEGLFAGRVEWGRDKAMSCNPAALCVDQEMVMTGNEPMCEGRTRIPLLPGLSGDVNNISANDRA